MGTPLYVIYRFCFGAFNILSVFNSYQFDYCVSVCSLLDLSPLGFSVLPGLVDYFHSPLQEFFSYYLCKYLFRS